MKHLNFEQSTVLVGLKDILIYENLTPAEKMPKIEARQKPYQKNTVQIRNEIPRATGQAAQQRGKEKYKSSECKQLEDKRKKEKKRKKTEQTINIKTILYRRKAETPKCFVHPRGLWPASTPLAMCLVVWCQD